MGISFGNTSKKPYVGSKEVKEAYVGAQKVYSATPPLEYGFLGAENDYMLASWCQLTEQASIVKESGIYRIQLRTTSDSNFSRITLTEIKGTTLKFTAKKGSVGLNAFRIRYLKGTYATEPLAIPTNNYSLYSWNVPSGTTKIEIYAQSYNTGSVAYLDAIGFEI